MTNVEFYIDTYLLYYDAKSSKGYENVHGFLFFCENKVLYGNIKSFYASVKKYYTFMYESKLVDKETLEEVKECKEYFE